MFHIQLIFKSNSISDYWTNYWYEVITSTCPLNLEYVFDFYWWYNFNFKYQSVWFRGQMPFQQGTYFKRSHYHFLKDHFGNNGPVQI